MSQIHKLGGQKASKSVLTSWKGEEREEVEGERG